MKIAVIMGSDSDMPVCQKAIEVLKQFEIEHTVHIFSAHRSPLLVHDFATNAKNNGYGVIIAAAGKAAHLAGVIASFTTLPVIGIPIKSSTLDGLDSLLSTVQMPSGIPVATVAIDGAQNAALLAIQMLAINNKDLTKKLETFKSYMAKSIEEKNEKGVHLTQA